MRHVTFEDRWREFSEANGGLPDGARLLFYAGAVELMTQQAQVSYHAADEEKAVAEVRVLWDEIIGWIQRATAAHGKH